MASRTMMSLPELLQPKVRYHGIPRRYEETKPVIVQDFTHRKIMDIGQEVHRRAQERFSQDRECAIRRAEEAVWSQAEVMTREAVENAIRKCRSDHEKAVRKLHKAHEKAIKEKALEVEGELHKIMLETVQETRLEGKHNLQVAVQRTEERCLQELIQAVAKAREEERKMAADKAAEVAQKEQQKFDAAMKKAAEEKAWALQALEARKDSEQEAAVAHAHKAEQDIATAKLAKMKASFEEEIAKLEGHIKEKVDDIGRLEEELQKVQLAKQRVEKEMLELREDFQNFIDKTHPFEKGKSAYLIPPVTSFKLP